MIRFLFIFASLFAMQTVSWLIFCLQIRNIEFEIILLKDFFIFSDLISKYSLTISHSWILIRFIFFFQQVFCQDSVPAKPPPCTGGICRPSFVPASVKILQSALDECRKCLCDSKSSIDWSIFCDWYTNYNQNTYKYVQCIIARLTNPCYKQYQQLQDVLNQHCDKICSIKPCNIYSLLSNICYDCLGCPIGCAIQNNYQIYYEPANQGGAVVRRAADSL